MVSINSKVDDARTQSGTTTRGGTTKHVFYAILYTVLVNAERYQAKLISRIDVHCYRLALSVVGYRLTCVHTTASHMRSHGVVVYLVAS